MSLITRLFKLTFLLALVAAAFIGGWLTGFLRFGAAADPASLPEVERQFIARMHGAALVGTFTVAGREGRTPEPDRYDIASVEKVGDNLWRFNTRMDCCGVSGRTIPIVVPMRFVGDTPMIMMTDTSIPGIGTFTVRVFFYGDRYAGTWQHGDVGGHFTGRIEKASDAAAPGRP